MLSKYKKCLYLRPKTNLNFKLKSYEVNYGSKTQVIDHILYSGLEPWLFQTVTGPWAGYTYISDHNPVMAQLRYHY